MNGKGDKPRPMQISREQWEANWEAIFGPKAKRAGKKTAPRKAGKAQSKEK